MFLMEHLFYIKKMSPEDLYKIVLNIDENWSVSCVKLDEKQEEVIVLLFYNKSTAIDPVTSESCSIYDHREERSWRHLDTMQYRTYINSKLQELRTV